MSNSKSQNASAIAHIVKTVSKRCGQHRFIHERRLRHCWNFLSIAFLISQQNVYNESDFAPADNHGRSVFSTCYSTFFVPPPTEKDRLLQWKRCAQGHLRKLLQNWEEYLMERALENTAALCSFMRIGWFTVAMIECWEISMKLACWQQCTELVWTTWLSIPTTGQVHPLTLPRAD
jgi:hypothetical protein